MTLNEPTQSIDLSVTSMANDNRHGLGWRWGCVCSYRLAIRSDLNNLPLSGCLEQLGMALGGDLDIRRQRRRPESFVIECAR